MAGFYSKCRELALQNRIIIDLNWQNSVEDILSQFVEILNGVLEGTEYYAERNSSEGEKNVDIFRKGMAGRIGHLWPRKRERIIHVYFAIDIVEQLRCRMDMPADSDVKEGRYLSWRAYRSLDFETMMKMINELARIEK